jgi:hypothetical protein
MPIAPTTPREERMNKHHDHLLTKKQTIYNQNTLATPWEEL